MIELGKARLSESKETDKHLRFVDNNKRTKWRQLYSLILNTAAITYEYSVERRRRSPH